MKKTLLAMLVTTIIVGLSACGPTEQATTEIAEPTPDGVSESVATPEAPVMESEAAPAPAEPASTPAEEAPAPEAAEAEWIALFNGENLDGLTARGAAVWEVKDGVLTGTSPGGQGHLYGGPELTDLEVKGMFKITPGDRDANSGLYFRANPPEDNVDGYPNGYEAQICHSQDAHTGWLWKPGTPTGKADKLLTKDGAWFSMRVKAVGTTLQIWVNDELVMTYEDGEYTKGYFALQCHNEGMTVEAKDLYYRDLSTP